MPAQRQPLFHIPWEYPDTLPKNAENWRQLIRALDKVVTDDTWTILTQKNDLSIASNNATGVNTDLQFVVTKAGLYEFEVILAYGIQAVAGTVPDMKLGMGEDNSTVAGFYHYTGINTLGNVVDGATYTGNNHFVVFGAGWTTPDAVTIRGHHAGQITNTPFIVKAIQNTSSARALVVKAGSRMRYRRVI